MSRQCPRDEIRNLASGRCVAVDSVIGRRMNGIIYPFKYEEILKYQKQVKYEKTVKYEKPKYQERKYEEPRKITLQRYVKSYRDFSKETCGKNLQNKLHQCDCPICWVVSSITSIVFSGLMDKFSDKYKKIINDAYSVFINDTPDVSVCPYIPIEIIKRYTYIFEEYGFETKIDINDVGASKGVTRFMIYAILGICLPDGLVLLDSLKFINPEKGIYSIDYERGNDVIIQQAVVDINLLSGSKKILNILELVASDLNRRGYSFSSGSFDIIPINPPGGHSMAFIVCNGKYYLCNSSENGCVDISNEIEYINYIKPYYGDDFIFKYITFIIKTINL